MKRLFAAGVALMALAGMAAAADLPPGPVLQGAGYVPLATTGPDSISA